MNPFSLFIQKNIQKIIFLSFCVGIAIIFFVFLTRFGIGESGYNFTGKTKKITLSPGNSVFQTFSSNQNNLHQIRIVLGNTSLSKDDSLQFQLLDEHCVQSIISSQQSSLKKQGAYTIFSFDPILDSKGKHYCFSVTFVSSGETKKSDRPYVSATESPSELFSDRVLFNPEKGKEYPSQTIFLRPAYAKETLENDIKALFLRVSFFAPKFLEGWPLVLGFIVFIIGSILIAFSLIQKEHSPSQEPNDPMTTPER